MEKRFQNKVALITGSTYGIGFDIARRLGTEGAKVVISSRKEENVIAAVDKLRKNNIEAFGVKCHIGNKSERLSLIEQTIEKYGQLDILVSNVAANPAVKEIFETKEGEWDYIFNINVKSSFMIAKEALPYLRKQAPGASITFISSIVGLAPEREIAAYSISKAALIALSKVVSGQLASEGIRVNCVAPGAIATPFLQGLTNMVGEERITSRIPLGRFGKPEEISGVVAFLVSNDASFITGETVVVAGGTQSRL